MVVPRVLDIVLAAFWATLKTEEKNPPLEVVEAPEALRDPLASSRVGVKGADIVCESLLGVLLSERILRWVTMFPLGILEAFGFLEGEAWRVRGLAAADLDVASVAGSSPSTGVGGVIVVLGGSFGGDSGTVCIDGVLWVSWLMTSSDTRMLGMTPDSEPLDSLRFASLPLIIGAGSFGLLEGDMLRDRLVDSVASEKEFEEGAELPPTALSWKGSDLTGSVAALLKGCRVRRFGAFAAVGCAGTAVVWMSGDVDVRYPA